MPLPIVLERAKLLEIFLDPQTGHVKPGKPVDKPPVQFNPESFNLKHNKSSLMDKTTSSLSVTLVFDVTALNPLEALVTDVQDLIREVDYFVTAPKPWTRGVRFLWGSFQFDGWITSIDKTFDSFAADGTPLRATVAITISDDGIFT